MPASASARSTIMRKAIGCGAKGSATMPARRRARSTAPSPSSPPNSSPRGRAGAARRPIRSSSSACRAPARPWSSRSSPAILSSKARRSFPTFRCSRAGSAAATAPIPIALPSLSAGEAARARRGVSRARQPAAARRARPFFIDKMPNNWVHAGLIQLILPNAKIVDARRHPLDCCFSNFKQHYARGQGFSYALADMGHYYADYVRLMAHFDAVLPGRVIRVVHERLVDDPEAEIRRLLDALGLRFRPRLPALPRERARGAHRQLGAGPPPDQPRRDRPVAALRALARPAEGGARPGSRRIGSARRRSDNRATGRGRASFRRQNEFDAFTTAGTPFSGQTLSRGDKEMSQPVRGLGPFAAFLFASTMLCTSGAAFAQGTPAAPPASAPPATTAAEDDGDDHRHRAEARGESAERADQHPGARHPAARGANVSNFNDYTKLLPSVSFQTCQPGIDQRLYPRRRQRRRRQPFGLAAQRRRLSRRAAGHDDRRHARRPYLRHRPHRGAARAAGHALRRLVGSRHDPHHHQQARPDRLLRRRSTAS